MEKMTIAELFKLKHSDKVYRWDGNSFRKLYFVGFMPRSERYLIFCDGEYLTHLYIGRDDKISSSWYKGDYNSKFVGEIKIKMLEERIESTKRIYIDK